MKSYDIKLFFLAVILLLISSITYAEQFSLVRGVSKTVLYTNRVQTKGQVVGHIDLKPIGYYGNVIKKTTCYKYGDLDLIIKAASSRYGVEPALIKAVIHAESSFNACARSSRGAVGLMQLMPRTARYLGVKNIYAPKDNLDGGVKYLAQLLNRYKGNLSLSLAAYNAGPTAVAKHKGVPPYSATKAYIARVLNLRHRYSSKVTL